MDDLLEQGIMFEIITLREKAYHKRLNIACFQVFEMQLGKYINISRKTGGDMGSDCCL